MNEWTLRVEGGGRSLPAHTVARQMNAAHSSITRQDASEYPANHLESSGFEGCDAKAASHWTAGLLERLPDARPYVTSAASHTPSSRLSPVPAIPRPLGLLVLTDSSAQHYEYARPHKVQGYDVRRTHHPTGAKASKAVQPSSAASLERTRGARHILTFYRAQRRLVSQRIHAGTWKNEASSSGHRQVAVSCATDHALVWVEDELAE